MFSGVLTLKHAAMDDLLEYVRHQGVSETTLKSYSLFFSEVYASGGLNRAALETQRQQDTHSRGWKEDAALRTLSAFLAVNEMFGSWRVLRDTGEVWVERGDAGSSAGAPGASCEVPELTSKELKWLMDEVKEQLQHAVTLGHPLRGHEILDIAAVVLKKHKVRCRKPGSSWVKDMRSKLGVAQERGRKRLRTTPGEASEGILNAPVAERSADLSRRAMSGSIAVPQQVVTGPHSLPASHPSILQAARPKRARLGEHRHHTRDSHDYLPHEQLVPRPPAQVSGSRDSCLGVLPPKKSAFKWLPPDLFTEEELEQCRAYPGHRISQVQVQHETHFTQALGASVSVDEQGELISSIPAALLCVEVCASVGAGIGGQIAHTLTDGYDFLMAHEVAWGLVRMHASKIRALVRSDKTFDVFGNFTIRVTTAPMSTWRSGTSGTFMSVASFLAFITGMQVHPATVFSGDMDLGGKVQRVADIVHKAKAAKEGGATYFVCPRENAAELLNDSSGAAAGLTVLPVEGLVDLVRHSIGHASPIANDDAAWERGAAMLAGAPERGALYGTGYYLTPYFAYYEAPTDKALAEPQKDTRNVLRRSYMLDNKASERAKLIAPGASSRTKQAGEGALDASPTPSATVDPEAEGPHVVGQPSIYKQAVHVLLTPGDKTVYATRGGAYISEAVKSALTCIGSMMEKGGASELRKHGIVPADSPLLQRLPLISTCNVLVDMPMNLVRTGEPLSAAAYMAVVAAITGWTADPSVAIWGEVSLHGYFLPLSGKSLVDVGLFYTNSELKTVIVPIEDLADFQALLPQFKPSVKREARLFRGAATIWDALPYAFSHKTFFADRTVQCDSPITRDSSSGGRIGEGQEAIILRSATYNELPCDMRVVDQKAAGAGRPGVMDVAVQCDMTWAAEDEREQGRAAGASATTTIPTAQVEAGGEQQTKGKRKGGQPGRKPRSAAEAKDEGQGPTDEADQVIETKHMPTLEAPRGVINATGGHTQSRPARACRVTKGGQSSAPRQQAPYHTEQRPEVAEAK